MRPIGTPKSLVDRFGKLIDDELKIITSPISKANDRITNYYKSSGLTTVQKDALKPVVIDFKSFLLLKPSKHQELINTWNSLGTSLFFDSTLGPRRKTTPFGIEILNILKYTDFRKKYGATIVQATGIKTCPYCNAMLTVVQKRNKSKNLHARCQLDHFFPKEKFPLLSISFFNLIPSCGQCNHAKSSSDVALSKDFHLYANETPINCFQFHLENKSVTKYLTSKNPESLSIEFLTGVDGSDDITELHDNSFNISGLYATQKDVAEELLWKSQAYSSARIKELAKITKLPIPIVQRMVIGTYTNNEDIHKRPLTKMIQDISRQLKLIK
jgi:hypothetical protein